MNIKKHGDGPNNIITNDDLMNIRQEDSKISEDNKLAEIRMEKSLNISSNSSNTLCCDFSEPLKCISNINALKNAICELPLNPCEQKYIATYIQPLSTVVDQLGRLSYDLSNSVNFLTNTTLVKQRTEELVETVNLIYDINNECEDIYCVIKKRLNNIICPVRSDK